MCNHRYESSAVTNYHENICKIINYNWKLQKFDILLCEERRIKISHRRVETRRNEINLFYLHVTSRLCNQILHDKRKKTCDFFLKCNVICWCVVPLNGCNYKIKCLKSCVKYDSWHIIGYTYGRLFSHNLVCNAQSYRFQIQSYSCLLLKKPVFFRDLWKAGKFLYFWQQNFAIWLKKVLKTTAARLNFANHKRVHFRRSQKITNINLIKLFWRRCQMLFKLHKNPIFF